MRYFIGIDSSTTATKALLMAENGDVVGVASATYGVETPQPLWSEQHPSLWWQATVAAARRVLAETAVSPQAIRAIGLTGQMHGLVLLDAQGEVLRSALLWNDQRTGAECDEMRQLVGKQRLIEITGNDALTGFTAPKILWVKNNEPDIYGRIAHILLPKDYVRLQLTGEYATDKAGGAGTQLFDLRQRDWSQEVVAKLGIDPVWLPKTLEGTAVTGHLTPQAAKATGLPAGIPVMAGGGDQAANAVGTGAVVDGIVALSLGTSGVIFASSEQPIVERNGRLHAFCHAMPNKWHLMGVMLSAAGSLRWWRDAVAPNVDFADLLAPANEVPAGSEGLLFLPYLTGERTPHPDPLARGGFVGLTTRHGQAQMTRAVLEGVAFGLRDNLELMRSAGLAEISQIRAAGGGLRSRLWRQILADVLQTEIVTVNTTEGAAYGAAILALVGAGASASVEEACAALVRVTGRTEPGADTAVYNQLYPIYQQLYPALKQTFTALSLQNDAI
ncbi:Xylulose kinase [hydrothermal vent metagenome]|uniref:Xylulose kinase n=1 Tax=hydrothermal vent metagenome TaxID=652676 RepID=A0A3B0VLR7_9ZZZZ